MVATPPSTPALVLPLASADAALQRFGGKGQSLAKLAVAGLPVPAGFVVTTTAYLDFVDANDLLATILDTVAQAPSTEQASADIQSLFDTVELPGQSIASVTEAYAMLAEGEPAVAVRSSATAEDLPEMSFAGQQDSYLNVRGEAALLEAVRDCWASLWTARAISYRDRMGIDHHSVAMGVVVQVMVDAEVSGVVFTANPSSGTRSELVVNASYGLGEAIVGGAVTPDSYVIDRTSLEASQVTIGSKESRVISSSTQGTIIEAVPHAQRREAALATPQLKALAALCIEVERQFDGLPQDIEWAARGDQLWLLQSRPVTKLPPEPIDNVRWDPPKPGSKLIRRQVVENMPEPLSPLFAELYLRDGLDVGLDYFMTEFGMPFDIDLFVERPFFVTVNGYAYCRADYRLNWALLRRAPRILFWAITSTPRMVKTVYPHWHDVGLPGYLATIEQYRVLDASSADDALLHAIGELAKADAIYWFDVSIVMGAAKMTDGLLHWFLASRLVDGDLTSGMFLSGFPSMTLQAQEDLEAIAQRLQATDRVRHLVSNSAAERLIDQLKDDPASAPFVTDIEAYLEKYGHQIYNLDFAEPTQGENPLPMLLSLKALVASQVDESSSRRPAMTEAREALIERTTQRLGPIRRWLFRKLLRWAQSFGPAREEALFYMGAAWPTLRRHALTLGDRLTRAGTISDADDVFYLESSELRDACAALAEGRSAPQFKPTAAQRRGLREARKRLHPPGMVPEKSRFKLGPLNFSAFETQKRNRMDADVLRGFAVSPGIVTGTACVILSPSDFKDMKPNSILVCPATTPAWTPLFAQAAALVTDIGGILAHGSIVAREYGIPAVMGTGNASQRIVSGQQITVDGVTGTVSIGEPVDT